MNNKTEISQLQNQINELQSQIAYLINKDNNRLSRKFSSLVFAGLRAFQRKRAIAISILLCIPLAVFAVSESEKLQLFIFVEAGEIISSSQVNENFRKLEERSLDLDPDVAGGLIHSGQLSVNRLKFPDGTFMEEAGVGTATAITANDDAKIIADNNDDTTGGIRFQLGSSGTGDKMYIDNNGKVGIGTVNPAGLLDVADVIYDQTTGNCLAGYQEIADYDADGDDPDCWRGFIFKDGNVGIGTAQPIGKFHIDVNADSLCDGASCTGNTSDDFIIDSDGNVGIGTTGSDYKLRIEDSNTSGYGVGVEIFNKSTSTNSVATFKAYGYNGALLTLMSADGLGTTPLGTVGGYIGNYSNHPLGLFTNNTERIRISNDGKVGIGTTDPQRILHVNGTSVRILIGDYIQSSADNVRGIAFQAYSNGNVYSDYKTNSGGTVYFRTGEGTERSDNKTWMAVDPTNGNVAIGTTTPKGRLHVKGENVSGYFGAMNIISVELLDDESVQLETKLSGNHGLLDIISTTSEMGTVAMRGDDDIVNIISDPLSNLSTTDVDGKICVIPDLDSTYTLKNRLGATRVFHLFYRGGGN
jgi:hypothetical protein